MNGHFLCVPFQSRPRGAGMPGRVGEYNLHQQEHQRHPTFLPALCINFLLYAQDLLIDSLDGHE